jgi:hypothetical protein
MLHRSAIGDGASRSVRDGSRMGDEPKLTGEWYKCSARSSRNLPAVSAVYSAASVRSSTGCSELGEFLNPTGKAQGPRSLSLPRLRSATGANRARPRLPLTAGPGILPLPPVSPGRTPALACDGPGSPSRASPRPLASGPGPGPRHNHDDGTSSDQPRPAGQGGFRLSFRFYPS